MFDPAKQTFLIVAAPPAGFMYTDPVAIQARTEPNATQPTEVDATLAAQNMALIEVRSVYDTDGLGRMGEGMLAAAISGLAAIWFLLAFLRRNTTDIFVIYRIGAAAVFAALLLLR